MSSKYFRATASLVSVALLAATSAAQTYDDPATAYANPVFADGVYSFNSTGYVNAGPTCSCNYFAPFSDPLDVWLAYVAPNSGVVTFTICPNSPVTGGSILNSFFGTDSALALWDDAGGVVNSQLDCQDGAPNCGIAESEVSYNVTAGSVYYVQCGNWGNSDVVTGSIAIGMPPPPGPGDDCTTAFTQTGPGVVALTGTTSSYGGSASCAGGSFLGDQWVAYTATQTGFCFAATCPSSTNAPGGNNAGVATFLAAFNNCPASPYSNFACAYSGGGCSAGSGAELAFAVTAGNTYYIECGDWNNLNGSVNGVSIAFNEIILAPAGPGDDCTVAVPATVGGVTPYNSAGFMSPGPIAYCTLFNSIDLFDTWMSFVAPTNGTAIASNCPGSTLAPGGSGPYQSYIAIWDGSTCPPTSQLACSNYANNCGGNAETTFQVTAGNTYYIQIGDWYTSQATAGNIALAIYPPPANDDCSTATPISVGTTTGNNLGATVSSPQGFCGYGFDYDVWYSFTSTCAGSVVIDTCGSTTDTWISVWDNCPGFGVELACNDNASSGPCQFTAQSQVEIPVTNGQTYYINVGIWGQQQGAFTLNVKCKYALVWSVPSGPGSLQLQNTDGPANALSFTAFTLDFLHGAVPPAQSFPNGWFFGVPLDYNELILELTLFSNILLLNLDGNGNVTNFTVPAGYTLSPTNFTGTTLWSVAIAFDPATGFATLADTTDPTAFTL